MRILVHDYAGHPFQVQLSRALAQSGHRVLHLHFASFQTPKGAVERRPDDPDNFAIEGLTLGRPFEKYNFVKRLQQEREYCSKVVQKVEAWRPDVMLSANMPLDPQATLLRACRRRGTPFVFWLQDLYSIAIDRFFSEKIPVVGKLIGWRYDRLERWLLAKSDHIICIAEDFLETLARWRIDTRNATVIHNWAPVEEYGSARKQNAWSEQYCLDDKFVFLYSGTLGIKHNPSVLLELAHRFAAHADVQIVVISEGPGADWLHDQATTMENLTVLPFQPNERFPEVLASGDVLLTLLGQEAGTYSVPSKVLSYLCAGRPILASIPRENLAARIIEHNAAGVVTSPAAIETFYAAASELFAAEALRKRLGENGAAYARREFNIAHVASRFEQVLTACVQQHQTPGVWQAIGVD